MKLREVAERKSWEAFPTHQPNARSAQCWGARSTALPHTRAHSPLHLQNSGEVRVGEGIAGGDALLGLVAEELQQEVEALLAELVRAGGVLKPLLILGLEILEEFGALQHLRRVRVAVHAWPRLRAGGAEEFKDAEELVAVLLAGEERLAGRHFGEDAAYGPHIDSRAVLRRAEQHVGGAVPERNDLVGVLLHGDAKGTAEAEIGELKNLVGARDEQILRLQIAVEDVALVAEVDALQQIAHEVLDGAGLHVAALLVHEHLEVHLEELKNERQLALRVNNVKELHNVLVAELLQEANLSDRRARHALLLRVETDALQRDDVAIGAVFGAEHDAVGALANLLVSLVLADGREAKILLLLLLGRLLLLRLLLMLLGWCGGHFVFVSIFSEVLCCIGFWSDYRWRI